MKARNNLFIFETNLWRQGYKIVGGSDEVGRGALAGPIVAATIVFLPSIIKNKDTWIEEVTDSKKLSPAKREYLYKKIIKNAYRVSVFKISNKQIDAIGIQLANKRSVIKSVLKIKPAVEYLLVDYIGGFISTIPHASIIKGDSKVFSIACASIVAKVTRDKLMKNLHKKYPRYKWHDNKGYGSLVHRQVIKKFGPSPLHRKTFSIS